MREGCQRDGAPLWSLFELEMFLGLLSGRAETKRKVVSLLMSYQPRESVSVGEVLIPNAGI